MENMVCIFGCGFSGSSTACSWFPPWFAASLVSMLPGARNFGRVRSAKVLLFKKLKYLDHLGLEHPFAACCNKSPSFKVFIHSKFKNRPRFLLRSDAINRTCKRREWHYFIHNVSIIQHSVSTYYEGNLDTSADDNVMCYVVKHSAGDNVMYIIKNTFRLLV